MAIKSQFASKCKDCGLEYEVGDEIDLNGNKSPNKKGEMKDHWCRDGKNCQGVMQLQGGSNPSDTDTYQVVTELKETTNPVQRKAEVQAALNQAEFQVNKEPTPGEILAFVRNEAELVDETVNRLYIEAKQKTLITLIQKAGIEDIMNKVGIQHPSRVSFMTEVMRRLQ